MRIHYLQHVPFEGPGSIEDWALSHGHTLTATRLYAGDPLPALDRFDLLVIMGGPMSIHDEAEYVWLKAENWFVGEVVEAGKPILGVCLGAQLLAEVLGAEISKNRVKEIGWFPVELDADFANTELGQQLPRQLDTFHWHGETFSLPPGCHRIASSVACDNQGFIRDGRLIGLQCHPEMTLGTADALIQHCADELVDGEFIQDAETMLADAQRFKNTNQSMATILNYLATQV